MIKLKKLALGTISTIAATTPIVVVASCRHSEPEAPRAFGIPVKLSPQENEGIGTQLKLLPLEQQDPQFINTLTRPLSNGERVMRDFTKNTLKQAISTANPIDKTIMFKVTFNEKRAKQLIQKGMEEQWKLDGTEQVTHFNVGDPKYATYTRDKKKMSLDFVVNESSIGFGSDFFEKIINPENTKDKMSVLSQAIDDLEREQGTDFRVVMQLALPKWLEEFKEVSVTILPNSKHQSSVFGREQKRANKKEYYHIAQIQSVINAKGADVKLRKFNAKYAGIKSFDPSNLPSGITKIVLEYNQLTTFDATKLPSSIEVVDLRDNYFSKSAKDSIEAQFKNIRKTVWI